MATQISALSVRQGGILIASLRGTRQLLPSERAKIARLQKRGLSIRVEKDRHVIFQSAEPMLRPLLHCLRNHRDEMEGAVVIDKIVGLAAAYLCIIGKVKKILTPLASLPAQEACKEQGIELQALHIIAQISNRDNTAPCPMEQLAMTCASPQDFLQKLKQRGL